MRRLAIISDVHSNREAFEAVLAKIRGLGVDAIYALGDIIGYGPDPVACTRLAVKHCAVRVMGNHEQAVRHPEQMQFNPMAEEAIFWTRKRIIRSNLMQAATDLPQSHEEEGLRFLHGSVRNAVTDYVQEVDDDGLSTFDDIAQSLALDFTTFRICFVGHNHRPFLATEEGFLHPHDGVDEFLIEDQKLYVSVGSVGQPRDGDPRACFVVFDGETVKYHRVEYPVEKTIEKILRCGLPELLAMRLKVGR